MFSKQILEMCTIIAYWVLLVPAIAASAKMKINNKPFDYFYDHSDYAVYLIIGYLVLYKFVCYILIYMKSFNMGLWHTLTTTEASCERKLEEAKAKYIALDEIDGPPATTSYSSKTLPRKQAPSGSTLPRKQAPSASTLPRKQALSASTHTQARAGAPLKTAPPPPQT